MHATIWMTLQTILSKKENKKPRCYILYNSIYNIDEMIKMKEIGKRLVIPKVQ